MLFDSAEAERLYCAYCQSHNPRYIAELHSLSSDLIKVIAGSLNQRDFFDDLTQEGHLKLQQIVVNNSYRLGTKCSMYTFLSYCLRNRMIDYLRKLKAFEPLDDNTVADAKCVDLIYDSSHFDVYYGKRFPSLANIGVESVVYIRDSIFEQANRSKVINTITDVYGLHRSHANLLHNSVSIFLKLSIKSTLTEAKLMTSLSYATNGSEMTLKPENVLAGNYTAVGYKELLHSVHKL